MGEGYRMKILRIYLMVVWIFMALSAIVLSVLSERSEDRMDYFLVSILFIIPTVIYLVGTSV